MQIECSIGNPLVDRTEFKLTFAINSATINAGELVFDAAVTTNSNLSPDSVVSQHLATYLIKKAKVHIESSTSVFNYDHDEIRTTHLIPWNAVVNVLKTEPSAVELITYTIKIPAKVGSQQLICLPVLNELSGMLINVVIDCVGLTLAATGVHSSCVIEENDFQLQQCPDDVIKTANSALNTRSGSVDDDNRESTPNDPQTVHEKHDQLIVDCRKANCITIQCAAGRFGGKYDVRTFVKMVSALNVTAVEQAFGTKQSMIKLVVNLHARIEDHDVSENNDSSNLLIVQFNRRPFAEKVKLGVIVGSSIAALIILLIIIVILWKVSRLC